MVPYGALRLTYRNFLATPPSISIVIAAPSAAEHDQAVGLDAGLDQLTQAGDAEARSDVVGVLAVSLGLARIHQAAPLRGRDADHEVELVLLGEFAPAFDDIAIVLRRHAEARAVVDPVVIEEHAEDLV